MNEYIGFIFVTPPKYTSFQTSQSAV